MVKGFWIFVGRFATITWTATSDCAIKHISTSKAGISTGQANNVGSGGRHYSGHEVYTHLKSSPLLALCSMLRVALYGRTFPISRFHVTQFSPFPRFPTLQSRSW